MTDDQLFTVWDEHYADVLSHDRPSFDPALLRAALAASMASQATAELPKLLIGGKYNWKGQRERLVYIGRNWSGNGFWHQFEKVSEPGVVWCEVTASDLSHFEESQPATLGEKQ